VIGMAASGAKYGIATSHFYWVGAIPAMVFVGVFMMPFYYGSRARSVPEYLKLRFDEKTRGFNAVTFAAMTVFSSGISMYAMGLLLGVLLGWDFNVSVLVSAVIVLLYIFLGGLTSAIYNEVLQFFLIVAGFLPLVFLGLKDVGGGRDSRHGSRSRPPRPASRPVPIPRAGNTWGVPRAIRWVWSGSAWSWGSASCSPSATGPPTSWWSSAPWPRTACRRRAGRP
jgi:Na+/proline symporter